MTRGRLVLLVFALYSGWNSDLSMSCASSAQQSTAISESLSRPRFEVVSVKEDRTDGIRRIRLSQNHFTITNFPLALIIAHAYGIQPDQLAKTPSWTRTASYRIDATLDDAITRWLQQLSPPERSERTRKMLQELLADRFNLRVSRTRQERSVYELSLLAGGPKFKQAAADDKYENGIGDGEISGAGVTQLTPGQFTGQGIPISRFVENLEFLSQGFILDRTGLSGRYDIKLIWDPNQAFEPSNAQPDSEHSSIYSSIRDQLGLKLQPTKAIVESIVVESVQRPSEN